jgi:hypothetical protein
MLRSTCTFLLIGERNIQSFRSNQSYQNILSTQSIPIIPTTTIVLQARD